MSQVPRTPGSLLFLGLVLLIPSSGVPEGRPVIMADDGRPVTFPAADGGTIHGTLFGEGTYGAVLAHGAIFNKESWYPFARKLAARGFVALSLEWHLAQAPEPKRLVLLPGSAHAQNIFATPKGPELERVMLEFLEAGRAS